MSETRLNCDTLIERLKDLPPAYHRDATTLIKCLFWLLVLTWGEPSLLGAVVAWIGRMGV